MAGKVKDIIEAIEALAPLDACMEGDNCGLMFGGPDREVSTALIALDVNRRTVQEAAEIGAELIIAHHPVFFDPILTLRADSPLGYIAEIIVKNGISVYCAHTNLDACPISPSAALAMAAGVRAPKQKGFLAYGKAETGDIQEIGKILRNKLRSDFVNVYGEGNAETAVFCGGSGNGELENAMSLNAGVFVCGELKYHQLTEYIERGIAVITCGHRESELAALPLLIGHLQKDKNLLQYNIRYHIAGGGYVLYR